MVKVRMPTGASLGQTDRILQQIEDAVAGDELIESMFTLAGGRVWGLYTYEIANEGELNIQLVPRGERDISTAEFVARLRPIVMTTVPIIVGFTPLALNLEAGGEMLQPMAVGAIGGLLVEMVVALLFLPCLYVMVTRKETTAAPEPAAG